MVVEIATKTENIIVEVREKILSTIKAAAEEPHFGRKSGLVGDIGRHAGSLKSVIRKVLKNLDCESSESAEARLLIGLSSCLTVLRADCLAFAQGKGKFDNIRHSAECAEERITLFGSFKVVGEVLPA